MIVQVRVSPNFVSIACQHLLQDIKKGYVQPLIHVFLKSCLQASIQDTRLCTHQCKYQVICLWT